MSLFYPGITMTTTDFFIAIMDRSVRPLWHETVSKNWRIVLIIAWLLISCFHEGLDPLGWAWGHFVRKLTNSSSESSRQPLSLSLSVALSLSPSLSLILTFSHSLVLSFSRSHKRIIRSKSTWQCGLRHIYIEHIRYDNCHIFSWVYFVIRIYIWIF